MPVATGNVGLSSHTAHSVQIREHKIPSAGSAPYICVEGPDRHLWFCESGAAKIGRFDPRSATLHRIRPADARRHADRHHARRRRQSLVRAEEGATRSAASRRRARSPNLPCRPPNAGPDGIALGPDGNVWFSETDVSQIGRITPDGRITEFKSGISPGSQAAVDRGARRRALVQRGGRQPRRPHHGRRRGDRIRHPRAPTAQPRAMVTHPDGNIWFVETGANALGRIDRNGSIDRVQGADAERVAARRHRRTRRQSLVHRELRQQDRLHGAGRHADRRIRHSDAGERRALHRARCRTGGFISRNTTPG